MEGFSKSLLDRVRKLVPAGAFLLAFPSSRRLTIDHFPQHRPLATWVTVFLFSLGVKLAGKKSVLSSGTTFYLILRSVSAYPQVHKKFFSQWFLIPYAFLFVNTVVLKGRYIDHSFKSKLDRFIVVTDKITGNNWKCDPNEYHPGQTCIQAFRSRSFQNLRFCCEFYPLVYFSMGVIKILFSRLKTSQLPFWILSHTLRSIGYAGVSALSCNTYPCFNRKVRIVVGKGVENSTAFDWILICIYFSFFVQFAYRIESPEQRVPLLVFTLYSLLFANVRYFIEDKIEEENLAYVLLPTLFSIWSLKSERKTLDQKLAHYLFD